MLAFQQAFIELAIEHEALCFGRFTLKSGRVSPFFFNAGRFCTAAALDGLGRAYAAAAIHHGLPFDLLFGPAYKGIPLVVATAVSLVRDHGRDTPYCFNRKEAKDHGEGGALVGAKLAGRVLVLDDVVTAGTAVREASSIIARGGASLAGVLVGLDRRERGSGQQSACDELAQQLGAPVRAIVSLDELIDYLGTTPELRQHLPQMQRYRDEWGPLDQQQ